MPRLCPSIVQEHRLTLGTYERKELRRALTIYQKDKFYENVPNYMLASAGLIGAAGVGWGLYKIGQGISMIDLPDLSLPNLNEWWNDDNPDWGPAATHEGGISPREAYLYGAPEYINYETGVVHKNHFHKVPLLGSLYGSGINIGIANVNRWRDLAGRVDPEDSLWENLFG